MRKIGVWIALAALALSACGAGAGGWEPPPPGCDTAYRTAQAPMLQAAAESARLSGDWGSYRDIANWVEDNNPCYERTGQ